MSILVRRLVPSGIQRLPLILLLPFAVGGHTAHVRPSAPLSASVFTSAQLHFEENRGQFHDQGKFVARGSGFTLALDPNQATMKLQRPEVGAPPVVVGMALSGGRAVPPVGNAQIPGVNHYLLTSDPNSWVQDVPSYARVHYEEVYPGIDLVFHSDGGQIEYDFVVAPGADPGRIKLAFSGIERAEVDAQGDLVLETAAGPIRQRQPRLYQEVDGVQQEVPGGFVLAPQQEVSFRIGSYDSGLPLVIDPVLVFSTLHGGCRGRQGIQDMTVDPQGSVYVVGYYPWDCDRGASNVFLSRFAPNGEFLFRSNFGGHFADEAGGIALDREGNIYLTGSTEVTPVGPPPFPTTADALQPIHGGGIDAFVMKLSLTGSTILYSTFLGGAGEDSGADIEVDLDGRIVVAGETSSTNFPTAAAWQPRLGGAKDAFISVLNPTGTALAFSTYLGGLGDETVARLAVGRSAIVVAGTTTSFDFPVRTSLQDRFGGGGSDAFLARLSPEGALLSSMYLGGSADEQAFGVAMDLEGFAYIVGSTNSSDLPTVNPLQPALSFPPEADAFLAKVSPDAGTFGYATYLDIGVDAQCLGLIPNDPCGAVTVDNRGNAYVTVGSPLSRGIFVTKVDTTGARRLYTFNGFGGHAIALRPSIRGFEQILRSPEIIVAGRTSALLFPVLNAFDSNRLFFETEEGWLMKLLDGPNPWASLEELDPHITYTGTWNREFALDHSRVFALRSSQAGSTASITFTGTGIQVIGRRDPSAGIVTVLRSFDPNLVSLDAFASPAEPRAVLLSISNLPFGTHTVSLQVTGTRNNRSAGTSIWIDGINILN